MSQGQGGGAPGKYSPKLNRVAKGLALLGFNDKEIAAELEINQDTLYEWMKLYPKFSESIKDGKTRADIPVVNALRQRALGFDYDEVTVEATGVTSFVQIDDEVIYGPGVTKRIVKKKALADVNAQRLYLMNRQGKYWGAENKHKVETTQVDELDLSKLTDDELKTLISLHEKAKRS